jgi:hypothetical protein
MIESRFSNSMHSLNVYLCLSVRMYMCMSITVLFFRNNSCSKCCDKICVYCELTDMYSNHIQNEFCCLYFRDCTNVFM